MNAPDVPDAGSTRRSRLGVLLLAFAATSYPALFHRVSALDVPPYGRVAPVQWTRLLLAWAITAAVTGVVVMVLLRFSRQPLTKVVLPSVGVVWFLSYSWRFARVIDSWWSLPAQLAIVLVVVLTVALAVILLRLARSVEGHAALVIGVATPLLLVSWQARGFLELPRQAPVEALDAGVVSPARDIWLLVFDALPSPEILMSLGWHPGELVQDLETHGFQVASNANTLTNGTYPTLGMTLSLDLRDPSGDVPPDEQGPWLAAMEGNHPLSATLVANGYEYIMVDNAWSWTRCGQLVTDCRQYAPMSDLEWAILTNSLASPFLPDRGPWRIHSLRQLEELEALASDASQSPRFIYAHLLVPHFQFELEQDCELRRTDPAEPARLWLRTVAGFREQMSCTATRIARLVELIPPDDVVLIVGDHGSDLSNIEPFDYTADDLRDRLSAFVAIRGCELSPEYLATNANSFRGLVSCVTTADLEPWPNAPSLVCVESSGVAQFTDATQALDARRGQQCRRS